VVRVTTEIYIDDVNAMALLVDAVAHPILPASRAKVAREGCAQRGSDSPWILGERSTDELEGGEGRGCGKSFGERSPHTRRKKDFVRAITRHRGGAPA
jgi:hypothetical protein